MTRFTGIRPKPFFPLEGQRRKNAIGVVECIVQACGEVMVQQEGTRHRPFLMPVREFRKLPKVDK